MKIINRRYRIIRTIEQDNTGDIYHAVDLMNHDRVVLLKVFNREYSKSDTMALFAREYRTWSSVHHDNIRSAYTFEVLKSVDNQQISRLQYLYTAEYIDEGDRVDHRVLNRDEINDVITQLCRIMQYLHFRGLKYRYLNLDNVVILRTPQGLKLKLNSLPYVHHYVDITRFASDDNRAFLAPETTWSEQFEFSSDLYALGIVLYFLYYKLDVSYDSIHLIHNGEEDNAMHDVIQRVTSSIMENRYEDINAFVEDLVDTLRLNYAFSDQAAYEKLQQKTQYVGNERILSQIEDQVFERLDQRRGTVASRVYGGKGLGKSRLLQELDYRLRFKGLDVIKQDLNRTWDEAFGSLKHILSKIVFGDKVSYELIQKYGPELVKLFPELRERWDIQPSKMLSEDKEHLRLANRLYNFLSDYAQEVPFVLILDNCEYLSRYEETILDFLFSDERANSFYVIISHGTDSNFAWNSYDQIHSYQLTPCTYEEASDFISMNLGIARAHMGLTTELMKATEGNPRQMQELLNTLYIRKYLWVNEERKWQFNLPEQMLQYEEIVGNDETLSAYISQLTPVMRQIVDTLSVFNEPVGFQLVTSMIDDLEENVIDQGLRELVQAGHLTEKFGDWGYTYDFSAVGLKSYIYKHIDEDQLIVLHHLAANRLENLYEDRGRHLSGALIHHLIKSNQDERAIEYCMIAAEEMEQFGIYNQAIDFYERAVGLHRQFDHNARIPELLYHIGRIKRLMGSMTEATGFFQDAVTIARENDMVRQEIDALIQLGAIAIENNQLSTAYQSLEQCRLRAKEIDYEAGEFESVYWLVVLYNVTGEVEGYVQLLPEYTAKAHQSNNDFYLGRFYSELAIWKMKIDDDEALSYFRKAIAQFRTCGNKFEEAKALNNLGVYYLEVLGQLEDARQQFLDAQAIVSDLNILQGEAIYLLNIGESYLVEDQYDLATQYLNMAMSSAERSESKKQLYQVMLVLCRTYLFKNDYKRVHAFLAKLDLEFQEADISPDSLKEYYELHLEVALISRRLDKSDRALGILIERFADFAVSHTTSYEAYGIYAKTLQRGHRRFEKRLDMDRLKAIVESDLSALQAKQLRWMIYNICRGFIVGKKFIQTKQLLDMDAKLEILYTSTLFNARSDLLRGVFEDNRIDHYEQIMRSADKSLTPEDRWFVHQLIGDEYLSKANEYQALTNYLSAMEIIRELTYQMPDEYRESYLLYDDVKNNLKHKINELENRVLGDQSHEGHFDLSERGADSIEEFFEVANVQKLYQNEKFQASIFSMYREKYDQPMQSVDDLIVNFKRDELSNLQTILMYCIQQTVADRGCLYITDDAGNTTEIIRLNNEEHLPDLPKVLSILGHDDLGIVTNKLTDTPDSRRGKRHDKSMLLLPIREPGADPESQPKRRQSDKVRKNVGVTGYLYLEAAQVFNRFSPDVLKELRNLRNMLYVMIDNYNMKKLSTVDKLTGVYLRKYMEERFAVELAMARSENRKLSVVMCDIDKFKLINDQFGHRKGDEILRKLGAELKMGLRDTDLIGRYGGEEFIILLPDTNQDQALEVCEKLRRRIMENIGVSNEQPITISLGISTYPHHGLNEEELIEKADQALYCSKNNGRNQTTLWNRNIGQDRSRFDKLAGILTGNISNDTRNIQAMMDIIGLLGSDESRNGKVYQLMTTLLDITEASTGTLVVLEEGAVTSSWSKEKGLEGWSDREVDHDIVERFLDSETGDFFINWNDIGEMDASSGKPNWKSLIVMPLWEGQQLKGQIHLSVPISMKEFDFSAFNFVNSVSSVALRLL